MSETTTATTTAQETSHHATGSQSSDDWLYHFRTYGYAVIPGSISPDKAEYYWQEAYKWLKSFDTALDFDNPETWIKSNLPVQTKINTFTAYGLAHEKFMWDARLEPGVIDAYIKLWATEELLVSFDSLNVTFPNRPEDGGLVVYPGSHLLTEEFFKTQTDKATWEKTDLYLFTDEQLSWFTNQGIKAQKICAQPGDLLIWDSRTIHWGAEPTEKSKTIRTVIYTSYAPASLATAETMEMKVKVFKAWEGTSHWPHNNIVLRKTQSLLDDGTPDPKSREEPLEKPELTDKLLKLAGIKPYVTKA